MHLAEAIESKHRVRERLVRALSRTESLSPEAPRVAAAARAFDPASEEIAIPESDLELNPLGEYLLNCELQSRTFTL